MGKVKQLFLIILIFFTGFVSALLAIYFLIPNLINDNNQELIKSEFEQEMSKIVEIDKDERQRYLDQLVKDGEINIQYSLNTKFKGKQSEDFVIKNIDNNKGNIMFTIYDSNDDVIYQSTEIQRGYECNKIILNKELPKGKNTCKISIYYSNKGNVKSKFPIVIEVV